MILKEKKDKGGTNTERNINNSRISTNEAKCADVCNKTETDRRLCNRLSLETFKVFKNWAITFVTMVILIFCVTSCLSAAKITPCVSGLPSTGGAGTERRSAGR